MSFTLDQNDVITFYSSVQNDSFTLSSPVLNDGITLDSSVQNDSFTLGSSVLNDGITLDSSLQKDDNTIDIFVQVDPALECEVCKKILYNKNALKRHKRIHDGVKPHPCLLCQKRFREKSALTLHIRNVHTGEKPHSCDFCPIKFSLKSYLNKHVRENHPTVGAI